jgi:hypothetical protein
MTEQNKSFSVEANGNLTVTGNIIENTEEQNQQPEVEGISVEQLEELMQEMGSEENENLPKIMIDMQDYDIDQFTKGIHDTSHLAGVVTALLNTGVSESFVLDYLLSKDSIAHNIEIANINKAMNVEMSKNKQAAQEKYEL